MKRNFHPSPSEMVMTAMFHLQKDWGTSLEDIIKYAKSKYGLSENSIKSRITQAVNRGLKYKLLYKKNGLYRLNGSVVKIPSESEGNPNGKRKEVAEKPDTRKKEIVSSMKKTQKRRKKKKNRVLFLCPECQVKENEENSNKMEGKLRRRDSDNGGSSAAAKDGGNSRKSRWKDLLKVGMSFRGRRPNKM